MFWMNVLIDLRALQSGNISGVEVFVKNLTENLCIAFPRVHFFLWTNTRKHLPENFPEFKFQNAHRIETHYSNWILLLFSRVFRCPKIDKFTLQAAQKKNFLRQEDHFDIVLIPDPRPSPTSKKTKKITIFHDLTPFHFSKSFSWKTRLWHWLLNFDKEVSESTRVLTPSHFTKIDILSKFKRDEKDISVIGAGRPKGLLRITDKSILDRVRQKYNLPEKFLLTLSTLEPRKNLKNLVEAFQRFQKKHDAKEFFLVIAGKTNSDIFEHIHLPKHPLILLPGFIAEDDKAALYSAATAFIFPSLFEGFGFPVLEALTCGTPVLCSNTSSLPEVYGNVALTFDPKNTQEITDAIETMYQNEGIQKELSVKGVERAQMPQFSWQTVAQKTMAIFEEVVLENNL